MFLLLGILWVALGAIPLIRAIKHRNEEGATARFKRATIILILDLIVLVLVNVFFGIATELWWFQSLGFQDRFWTEYTWRILLFVIAAAIGAPLFGFGLRALVPRERGTARNITLVLGLVAGGVILGLLSNSLWQPMLMYVSRATANIADPVLGLDLSFYLFGLPLFQAIRGRLIGVLLAYLVGVALLTLLFHSGQTTSQLMGVVARKRKVRNQVYAVGGTYLLLSGIGRLLDIPGLMYSEQGAVTGIGWIEANVLIPANIVAAVVLLATAVLLFVAVAKERPLLKLLAVRRVESGPSRTEQPEGEPPRDEEQETDDSRRPGSEPELRLTSHSWIAPVAVVATLFLVLTAIPGLLRGLVLDPNEITLESEYIPYHIDFTRNAYAIDDERVTETQYDVGTDITQEVLDANEPTMQNIRLWDWRALKDNLQQQQEIRLYYEFNDVDIDRYDIDGRPTQMMLSVRELEKSALDEASQTWVSRHFKYTHGYGLVSLPVHEFLPQGRPDLYVKNIPPEPQIPRFELNRPEIYYGERTDDHVYVNTTQQEFDYPAGDQNIYTDYAGEGGVPIGGFLRRLAFAWRIDGYRQLLSSYVTGDTKMMFRREVTERARAIAPFLTYDRDPYPVVTEDGHIKFIIDAYTTSRAYPYSEPYRGNLDFFNGINYMRNSVKVVVDAYDGSVDFYVVQPDDPIISTFENIFGELFQSIEDMPDDLKDHIRYPADLLTVQAEMYATYHMTEKQVFYQREDVWQFATERYRANFQDVEPYYIMLQYPGETEAEFILMLPFTPKNKNVINAWMAGRSDYEHYGELTVYPLPKGTEVLGPRQIEARIDQNTEMSQSLSLWGQRGSEVVRGNLLTIPLFYNDLLYILYVEPIYLQAEDAQLPEIKRIALADQSRVVWGEEFETAVDRLLGELPATPGGPEAEDEAAPDAAEAPDAAADQPEAAAQPEVAADAGQQELVSQANEALARYQRAVSNGEFSRAGQALEELQSVLERLAEQAR